MESINLIEMGIRLVRIYCAYASIKAFNITFVQEFHLVYFLVKLKGIQKNLKGPTQRCLNYQ